MIQKLTKKLILTATVFFSTAVIAQTVVISEVGFKSTSSDEDFVELYNTTGSAIDLTGYTLVPSVGSTVTLTGTIPASGFYVIGKNETEVNFELAWGVTIGGTSEYQNSNSNLSTTSGVTFSLKNASSTELDNTTGYGITLGTRIYQCPVGTFEGNDQSNTSTSDCNPGGINAKRYDDLTYWTISRYNGSNQIGSVGSGTGSDNLIVKKSYFSMISSFAINDVLLANLSNISIVNESCNISGDLIVTDGGSVKITGSGDLTIAGSIYTYRSGVSTDGLYNLWSIPYSNSVNIESNYTGANPCDIYAYNASSQEWKYDYSVPYTTTCNSVPVTITSSSTMVDGVSDGNFDIGRGYFIPGSSSNTERTLVGSSLNNGDIATNIYGSSVSLVGGNDWNLIGNPYHSGLNVLSLLNNTNNAALFSEVYIYKGSTGTYTTLNTGNAANWFISSFQGFYINATSSTDGLLGTVEFTNSMRSDATWFWRNNNATMYLSIKHDTLIDPIQIILDQNSSNSINSKHDAFKIPNTNGLNFASDIENELLVFNGIKTLANQQTKTVKLFVQTPENGNYQITLDSLNLIDDYLEIQLEDKDNNSFTDLRNEPYSFSTSKGDSLTNRFFLHLTNTVTSVDEVKETLHTSIYLSNEAINVTILGNSNIENVHIYDITGRLVYSEKGNSNSMKIESHIFNNAIYIVKVTDELGNMSTQRVFVK